MTVRELVTKLGFEVNDSGIKNYEKSIDSLKSKVGSLSKGLSGVGTIMKLVGSAVATAGIVALGKSILDTTGEIEQYRVTLGTMIGDQEKANQIIHDLDYSPVSDFYGTANAIGGLQGMVTFGMDAEKASETLTRLGDIAQGNSEAFKSLSLNMGQVFAKGKADATDLKQFVGQGFDVVGEVSKMTGKSRAEIEKAGVSYEQCAKALEHITNEGGKYYGMLQKQSQTIPGLIKQFQSLSAAIKEGIGTNMSDRVKSLLNDLLKIVRQYQDRIVELGTKLFNGILDAIVNVIGWVEVLAMRTNKFEGFRKLIEALIGLFGILSKEMIRAFTNVVPFIDKVAGALANVINFLNKHKVIVGEVLKAFLALGVGIAGTLKIMSLVNSIKETTKAVNGLFKLIKSNPTMMIIFAIITGLMLIITHLDQIKSFWENMATPIKAIVIAIGAIVGIIMAVITAVKLFTAVMTVAKILMIVFNAICAVNPLILIIMAIILAIGLLIGAIIAIVKNWDKVKQAFVKFGEWVKGLFNSLKETIVAIWTKIVEFFSRIGDWLSNLWSAVIEKVKNIWNTITEFFSTLWEGIKAVFTGFVEWVKLLFTNPLEAIKQLWNGLIDFYSNLWSNIGNVFTGAINSIKEKIFGFWDGVKGVFSKIGKFFGIGDSDVEVNENKNVTSTTSQDAMKNNAGVNNSYASTINNNSVGSPTVNSQNSITVNVPQGTSAEQAEAISRQVEQAINDSWASAIGGGRAMIPSPEARSF